METASGQPPARLINVKFQADFFVDSIALFVVAHRLTFDIDESAIYFCACYIVHYAKIARFDRNKVENENYAR